MKSVKIVRATKGNEAGAAAEIAVFYNEAAKEGIRTSRAVVTAAGEDVVYTIFADQYDAPDQDSYEDDEDSDTETDDDVEDEDCENAPDDDLDEEEEDLSFLN